MKTLIIAAVVFAASVTAGFAGELKGKIGDLKGVSLSLATASQPTEGFDAAKLAKVEKMINACDIHVTSTAVEGMGKLRCAETGLKVDAEVRQTSSGINLANGECTTPTEFVGINSLFGWKNISSICNIGGTRYRMIGSAKVPANFKI